jgi:hypothetical protein
VSNNYRKAGSSNTVRVLLSLLLTAGLAACANMPKSGTATEEKSAPAEAGKAAESTPVEAAAAAGNGGEVAAVGAETAKAAPKAPTIVESCKNEPYVGYEKQARESIAKGLAATQAKTYGVGFRDLDEHKRWTSIHDQLFAKVNKSCQVLSECAKQNPKDKATKCAGEAKTFSSWQKLAAQFAEKAKVVESTLPPIICSFEPNLDDPARCFHDLAANVDAVCDKAECKELSSCWREVGYLDAAIEQSKLSCGFVHAPLEKCRGYTEAKGRREKKFEHCKTLQGGLKITVMPAL